MDDQNLNHLISAPPLLPDSLKGVKFTPREIDVLACILGGRTGKKMAALLSLSPKTVENYIHVIMQKLECSSRESIKDWLETCEEIDLLKKHYSEIFFKDSFEKHLKDLSTQSSAHVPACSLIYWLEEDNDKHFISQLEKHLKLAGVTVSLDPRIGPCDSEALTREAQEASNEVRIFVVPSNLINTFVQSKERLSSGHLLLLMKDKKQTLFSFVGSGSTEGGEQNNYHTCLVELIKNFFPAHNFASLLFLIKKHYQQTTKQALTPASKQRNITIQQSLALILRNRKWQYSFGAFLLIAFVIVLLPLLKMKAPEPQVVTTTRSDLVIPTESAFLNRSELIARMDEKFRGQKGIQTLALVGVGGAGKTTLARQYAQQDKANVVWEINAETRESLNTSFEALASSLAKTAEDKSDLKDIQDIKDTGKREEKLVQFVKTHLKATSDWFLIFDNVEKFTDVQAFFPQDAGTWGQGKIILTTRDRNIENNNQINAVLSVGELDPAQKLALFTRIMNHGADKSFAASPNEETERFLAHIPSFPLDVSVAAYYLKMTGISYDNYLTNLEKYQQDFASVQENLLKEAGTYVKTRYGIVTLSLKEIIKVHKDFGELLLFISLLDSQQIPRDLLDAYKGAPLVDNFIYHLKKYSLITNDVSSSMPTLSIHRSTQNISLAYLSNILNLTDNKTFIEPIVNVTAHYLREALEKEELSKIRPLISHLETFLTHDILLTDKTKAIIENNLGHIYSSLSLFGQANDFLAKALLKLEREKNPNYKEIAKSLLLQGNAYNMIGKHNKAEKLLEDSIFIYKKHLPNDKTQLALGLVYLGNVYKWTGNYEKAKLLFKQAIEIYESLHSPGTVGNILALTYLGDTYRKLGDYNQAIAYSTKSLSLCRQYLPKDSVRTSWPIINLGVAYQELGEYEKSIEFISKSIEICEANFSKNSLFVGTHLLAKATTQCALGQYSQAIYSVKRTFQIYTNIGSRFNLYRIFGFSSLGSAYKGLGDYAKAKVYLEKSLKFTEAHFGKDHLETAHVIESLGQLYLAESALEQAQHFLTTALQIYEKNNHPSVYICFEDFSDLHLKKAEIAARKGELKEAERFKIQAMSDLKNALEIIKARFPEDSPHKARIESKISKIENA